MTTPFDDLIRTTMSEIAQEALPMNLTPRAFDQVRRRRTTTIVLSAAAVVTALMIGTPLALAAANGGNTPAAPSPSPSVVLPVPSPSASAALPVPSPSASAEAPVPSASPVCTDLHPAPGTPCFLVPIPSPTP